MNTTTRKKNTSQKGAVLMFVVLMMTVTTVAIAIGFTTPNIREYKNSIRDNLSNNAFLLAEAGNEDVFYRLKNGMNVPAEIVMTLNNTIATTSVSVVSDVTEVTTKSSVENHTRKSQLKISGTGGTLGGVDFAAHVGTWGIEMSNNANVIGISPAVGEIYSNGSVRGASNVTVTGDIYAASNLTEDTTAIQTSCASDQIVGKTNPVVDHAQSFIASSTSEGLGALEIYIKKNGNPSSKTIRIVADNGGVPDTTTITSGTLDRNKVTSSYAWVKITLDTPTVLVGGNTYWIVLDTTRHNSKYWFWCKDATEPYAGGVAMYTQDFTSPSWVGITGDLTFKLLYGEGESLIQDVPDIQGDAHADVITNSTISGDAYYQSISGSSVGGSSYSGSPTPPVLPFPLTDTMMSAWVAEAEAGGTISGNCPGSAGCSATMGPTKIDGNLDLENGDTLTVAGTIYVTGRFTTDNNVTVDCHPAYGSESCIIISDGYMAFSNNSDFQGSGIAGSFILLITTKSDCIGTSGTGCASGNSGLHLSNNGVTGGVFFAQESIALLENNASVSSVIARGVKLDNNASLIYDQDLQDLNIGTGGGGGGGAGFLVEDWREIE